MNSFNSDTVVRKLRETSLRIFTPEVHRRKFIIVCTGVCHRPCYVSDKSALHHYILIVRCLCFSALLPSPASQMFSQLCAPVSFCRMC